MLWVRESINDEWSSAHSRDSIRKKCALIGEQNTLHIHELSFALNLLHSAVRCDTGIFRALPAERIHGIRTCKK